jgi:two-component system cell cycle response regulator DivK
MQVHRRSSTSWQTAAARTRRRSTRSANGAPKRRKGLDGARILVVEDDPPNARFMVVLLEMAGADVRVAQSAEDALKVLDDFRAEIIILDLILPRMSGLLLARQLKSLRRTRGIVIIAVSAVNGPEIERLVEESGCAAYVRKPIDVQTFAHVVAGHFKSRS